MQDDPANRRGSLEAKMQRALRPILIATLTVLGIQALDTDLARAAPPSSSLSSCADGVGEQIKVLLYFPGKQSQTATTNSYKVPDGKRLCIDEVSLGLYAPHLVQPPVSALAWLLTGQDVSEVGSNTYHLEYLGQLAFIDQQPICEFCEILRVGALRTSIATFTDEWVVAEMRSTAPLRLGGGAGTSRVVIIGRLVNRP
jgi:hypothetical protein